MPFRSREDHLTVRTWLRRDAQDRVTGPEDRSIHLHATPRPHIPRRASNSMAGVLLANELGLIASTGGMPDRAEVPTHSRGPHSTHLTNVPCPVEY